MALGMILGDSGSGKKEASHLNTPHWGSFGSLLCTIPLNRERGGERERERENPSER